jgi:predicted GNAT family acetyltransferase
MEVLMVDQVEDNTEEQRFELKIEGQTAYVYYALAPGIITLMHTDVPLVMSGQGVASRLLKGVLDEARGRGLKVKAECPFAQGYLGKHPEFADIIA